MDERCHLMALTRTSWRMDHSCFYSEGRISSPILGSRCGRSGASAKRNDRRDERRAARDEELAGAGALGARCRPSSRFMRKRMRRCIGIGSRNSGRSRRFRGATPAVYSGQRRRCEPAITPSLLGLRAIARHARPQARSSQVRHAQCSPSRSPPPSARSPARMRA